jgi:hypothetical protein
VNGSVIGIQYRCRLNSSRGQGRRIALLGNMRVGRLMGRLVPGAGGRIGLMKVVWVIGGMSLARTKKTKKTCRSM